MWLILLPWLIAISVLTGFLLYGLLTPYTARMPPSKAGALVWGGGIFANKHEFSGWLRHHGSSYATWKKLHPAAAKLLTPNKHVRRHRSAMGPAHVAKRPVAKPTLAHSAPLTKPHAAKVTKRPGTKARAARNVPASVTPKVATSTPAQSASEARSRTTWMLLGVLGLLIALAATSVIRARRGHAERLRPAFSAALDLLHADVVVRKAEVARVSDAGFTRDNAMSFCRRALLYLSVCGGAAAVGWLASLAGRL